LLVIGDKNCDEQADERKESARKGIEFRRINKS